MLLLSQIVTEPFLKLNSILPADSINSAFLFFDPFLYL